MAPELALQGVIVGKDRRYHLRSSYKSNAAFSGVIALATASAGRLSYVVLEVKRQIPFAACN